MSTEESTIGTGRHLCRHIHLSGVRCASPCMRGEQFCYFHHTTRKPIQDAAQRKARTATFELPNLEDRSAIQYSIGEVLQRLASNDIDPRRAGQLLYGLQIASLNLPKAVANAESKPQEQVEEIVVDPELGTLAPPYEIRRKKSFAELTLNSALAETSEQRSERESRERREKVALAKGRARAMSLGKCYIPPARLAWKRNWIPSIQAPTCSPQSFPIYRPSQILLYPLLHCGAGPRTT